MATATLTAAISSIIDSILVSPADCLIKTSDLVEILLKRSLAGGRGAIRVEYTSDMLAKGKLLVAAKKRFTNGLNRVCGKTVNVSFDYETVLDSRSDGTETPAGTGSWHCPVMLNGKITALAVHKKDLISDDPQVFSANPRIYLRYELGSDAQREVFGKKDFAFYCDDNGTIIADDEVAPFYGASKEQTVDFRILPLSSVLMLKTDGIVYRIAN